MLQPPAVNSDSRQPPVSPYSLDSSTYLNIPRPIALTKNDSSIFDDVLDMVNGMILECREPQPLFFDKALILAKKDDEDEHQYLEHLNRGKKKLKNIKAKADIKVKKNVIDFKENEVPKSGTSSASKRTASTVSRSYSLSTTNVNGTSLPGQRFVVAESNRRSEATNSTLSSRNPFAVVDNPLSSSATNVASESTSRPVGTADYTDYPAPRQRVPKKRIVYASKISMDFYALSSDLQKHMVRSYKRKGAKIDFDCHCVDSSVRGVMAE